MRKLVAVSMVGALAASVLAGCGSSTASSTQADATAASVDKGNTKAQEAQSRAQGAQSEAGGSETPITDSGEKIIYAVVKALGNQYWGILQAGVEQVDKDPGYKAVVVGIALESDIGGQLAFLQSAISARAAGIVIAPLDSASLNAPIMEIYNSGTPVVLMDTVTKSDNHSAALLTNNVEAGETAAEEMIRRLKAKGLFEDETAQIAIQVGPTSSQTINDRVKGFNECWEANTPEKWVVLNDNIKVDEDDISRAIGFCQDSITAYPDLKGVFGSNNGSTVGFVTELTESRHMGITTIGLDFSAEIETMIRSNKYNAASVVQRQYFMEYDGAKTVVESVNGRAVEDKTTGTDVVLVGSKNVDSNEVQEIIHP